MDKKANSTDQLLPPWVADFPSLKSIGDEVWLEAACGSEEKEYAAGSTIIKAGDNCNAFLLVRSGHVRVVRRLDNGRELVMYRLFNGSSCSTTTAMLLGGGIYSIDLIAEENVSVVFIPKALFQQAFEESREFRDYVCQEFGGRIQQLVQLLESVMLRNVGVRLAKWLLSHQNASGSVAVTHQVIAADLGTAREVISRHLKHFEALGYVELERGNIKLLDRSTLSTVAAGTLAATPLAELQPRSEHRGIIDPARTSNSGSFGSHQAPEWTRFFSELEDVDDEVWQYIAGRAKRIDVEAGTQMFSAGDECSSYVLVLGGCVKVYKSFGNGREFVLYRLERGDTCCATTSVLLGGDRHVTDAVAEQDTSVVLIPRRDFEQAFHDSRGFRHYVLSTYGTRVQQLILLLESVMAQNVEVRLARCILERAGSGNTIEASHGELAVEVGTAREVVSRKLKQFERQELVGLDRRQITILDRDALKEIESGKEHESDFVTNF